MSTKAVSADDSDLDPAAFLQSVRELSAKREREDNERFKKLEEEIEKGRQERLARRAEYARSVSPEKRDSTARSSQPPPSRSSSSLVGHSPRISSPSTMTVATETSSSRSSVGVEEVPEFAGFGSMKRASTPSTPTKQTAPTSPSPKPSPSAAMPSRSGTVKWQQRPQSRAGGSRPLSMVAAENAQAKNTPAEAEPSKNQIAASLASRDPSWFRQTADRGIGNAAYRKSTDVDTSDVVTAQRKGLPGMTRDAGLRASSSSTSASLPSSMASYDRSTAPESQADISLVESEASNVTSQSETSNRSSASTSTLPGRFARGLDRSPSPTKEMGGFVQSAMMKRSNSINKRSVGQYAGGLDRASSIRGGYGGLQGSHSMPKLDQPTHTASDATDSLVRPLSSINLLDKAPTVTPAHHSRAKSITSAYTTNDHDNASSLPPSPSKRWSPNKSSWIESALTAKPESRPASPTKNSQPSWMSDLAKVKAQRANAETEPLPTPAKAVTSPKVENQFKTSQDFPKDVLETPLRSAASPKPDAELLSKPVVPQSKPYLSASLPPKDETPTPTPQTTQSPASSITSSRPKPQPSPKPQIDFRSTLKPRAATEPKPQEQPEFLSRFGTLRKTTTEKYVAPDLLKDNILRGKAGLTFTDGPQKRERRDELKESLLAKKDQWRQEKQEGVVHEHKTTGPPAAPEKPEALAKRDVLGRTGTVKATSNPEKPATPEALRQHQSIRQKPVPFSAPAPKQEVESQTPELKETSKLAAKFNPALAGILARGPPSTPIKPDTHANENVASVSQSEAPREPTDPLQDMRKGRAKGPKRRKAGASAMKSVADMSLDDERNLRETNDVPVQSKASTPRPGSTASIMIASLNSSPGVAQTTKPALSPGPAAMQNDQPRDVRSGSPRDVPDFKGFSRTVVVDIPRDDDKENNTYDSTRGSKPSPIQVLSKKDEEAAMRSAKLLSSSSPMQARSPSGLGISGPPRPSKSSRIVSGQLQEASLNKVLVPELRIANGPESATRRQSQRIDVTSMLTTPSTMSPDSRTFRVSMFKLNAEGRLQSVSPRDEYTLSEDAVYVLKHVQARRNGTLATDVYTWHGKRASQDDINATKFAVKSILNDSKSAMLHTIRQGYETKGFLHAIGGILIIRVRSTRASEPYMLCGRKHLGYIVFDEVGCHPGSLCSAFVYLIWNPVTIKTGVVFLWTGSACSTEEVSAARLAAMDLSENGDIVEVDEGCESTAFWKLFSAWPIREDVPPCPEMLKRKVDAADKFEVRLFTIRQQEAKQGFFTSMLSRRPSWGSRSPAPPEEIKYEAKEIVPFTQTDLDAEGIYILDGYTQVDVLVGPLSPSKTAAATVYLQALYAARDYAELCDRPTRPEVCVLHRGIPDHIPYLFRHWDEDHGLWSTGGLMAGHSKQDDVQCVSLPEALSSAQPS